MKKILSVFLVLAMMLSLVVVTTVAPSATPVTEGTKLTGQNLMSLTAGEYYMTEDIDFQGFDLSTMSAMTLPAGTVIHGNGYSIKGLNSKTFAPFTVNGTVTINDLQIGGTDGADVYNGLFELADGATLNLNNVDINIKSTNGVESGKMALTGAIAGYIQSGATVNANDCTVSGAVGNNLAWNAYGTGQADTNAIGGFVGLVCGTLSIDNCTMNAALNNSGCQTIGGFVGTVKGEVIIKNSVSNSATTITGGKRAGGFVGYLADTGSCDLSGTGTLTIEKCINRSDIKANNQWVGGFVGINRGVLKSITDSMNLGNVEVTGGEADTGVAGFVGQWNTGSTTMSYLKNCVNYGNISTVKADAAAMIGWMAWASNVTVSNCVNYGSIYAKTNDAGMVFGVNKGNASSKTIIEKCVNYGTIQSDANVGLIAADFVPTGKAEGMYVATNCLNVGELTGGSNSGAMLGYDEYTVSLTACSTIGTFNVTSWYAGGIFCGRTSGSELINCYNYGKMVITGNNHNGTICANESGTLSSTSTGNKYLYDPEGTTTYNTNHGTKAASVDEAVADLNALYNDTLGLSFKNNNGKIEVVTQPKLVGTQESATGAKVRLLGSIGGDLADYAKVGFKVTSVGETVKTYNPSEATYAYYHIQAAGEMTTAASLGGSYLYTLTFTGVPQTGTVTFTVQAYAEYTNGLTYDGATYTVTVVDGVVTSTTLAD